MPRKIKMEVDSDEDDDGPMPDWKRKKNLEKLQKLKVGSQLLEISKSLPDFTILFKINHNNVHLTK